MRPMVGARARFRGFLGVGLVALVVRLSYFREHLESAFFGVPILDEKFYDTAAKILANGGDLATLDPGFRPLLYPLLLSFWYRLAGDWGDVVAIAAQHCLGVLIAVLVTYLAAELFRRLSAGVLAGGFYALSGPPLYFEGELLITTLYTFLGLASVLALVWASRGQSGYRWWLAGVALGLAAQARANILLLLVVLPVAWLAFKTRPGWQRAGSMLSVGLGTMMTLLLFALWQTTWLERFQLLPSAGGVNFYLGNKAGADGMVPRQDWAVTYGREYRDSVAVFATEGYLRDRGIDEPSHPSAISRYWFGRTAGEIAADPGRWLGLVVKKVMFLAWNHEIPNNKSLSFIRTYESAWLAALPVDWWWLWTFAPLGLVWAWRWGEREQLFWLAAFLLTSAAGIVLFFVNARYRVPLWPGMAVLAGGGAMGVVDLARQRNWPKLGMAVLGAAVLATLSLNNWLGVDPETPGRDFFFRSIARLEKGDAAGAVDDAGRSVKLLPGDPAALFQLGNAALALDDRAQARSSFLEATRQAPGEPRIFNNLAILDEKDGRVGAAYRGYLHALTLAEDYAPALVNAALLELRAGLPHLAEPRLQKAADVGFRSLPMLGARALMASARGDEVAAQAWLGEARGLSPEGLARFLALHQARLQPSDLGLQNVESSP